MPPPSLFRRAKRGQLGVGFLSSTSRSLWGSSSCGGGRGAGTPKAPGQGGGERGSRSASAAWVTRWVSHEEAGGAGQEGRTEAGAAGL